MSNSCIVTKQVWKYNFEDELYIVRQRAVNDHYSFFSLTTRLLLCEERIPSGTAWGDSDANYSALSQTTDSFKNIVQVGLALCDEQGNLPLCRESGWPCIWEFNLMPLEDAAINPGKVDRFLEEFCGDVNAEQLRRQGIDPKVMFYWLGNNCLFMNEKISWVMFKGGLDIMALLRWFGLEFDDPTPGMPLDSGEFFRLLDYYFPVFYEMAAVLGFDRVADNGTIDVSARSIDVWREDMPPHGAASDSLLALRMFMQIKRRMEMRTLRPGCARLEKKARVLFGVTSEEEANATPTFKMAPC